MVSERNIQYALLSIILFIANFSLADPIISDLYIADQIPITGSKVNVDFEFLVSSSDGSDLSIQIIDFILEDPNTDLLYPYFNYSENRISASSIQITGSFELWFYDPPGTYTFSVVVTDQNNDIGEGYCNFEYYVLQAIGVLESSIEFGTVQLDSTSTPQIVNIQNLGNVTVDLYVEGTDLTDSGLNSIPVEQIEYSSDAIHFYQLNISPSCINFNLFPGEYSIKEIRFRITIPSTQKAGIYTGNVSTFSTADGSCWGSFKNSINLLANSSSQNPTSGTVPVQTPSLIAPSDNSTDLFLPIDFDWNTSANGSEYEIEIAKDLGFNNIVVSQKTDFTLISIPYFEENQDFSWHVRALDNGISSSWSDSWTFEVADFLLLDAKIFFEGPYVNNGIMNTTILNQSLIPLGQHYNIEPWHYSGYEATETIPQNVVDWVLIELRESSDIATAVTCRAGFILSNGTVVDLDGSSPLGFSVPEGNYYVVVLHRNHISVMSSTPVHLSNN